MATVTETPKSRKVSRSVRSLRISDAINGMRTLVITRDGDRVFYTLKEIPADFGRGFTLTKCAAGTGSDREADAYHVNVDGACDSCTCKGHTYRDRCKHADALRFLLARGTL